MHQNLWNFQSRYKILQRSIRWYKNLRVSQTRSINLLTFHFELFLKTHCDVSHTIKPIWTWEIFFTQGSSSEGTSRETRRDENPFSFKHFLKKDSKPNYNLTGARPKIYSPARISPSDVGSDPDAKYPCNPTELPDFVQDHLVIEQCYLNQEAAAAGAVAIPLVADINNLPDFTINNAERRQGPRSSRNEAEKAQISCDLPFDLTGGLERRKQRSNPGVDNGACNNPPVAYPRPNQLPVRQNESARNIQSFPFDLPSSTASSSLSDPSGPNNSPANENSVNKSLPDFLNDGPIRNRVTGESDSSLDLPERPDNAVRHYSFLLLGFCDFRLIHCFRP